MTKAEFLARVSDWDEAYEPQPGETHALLYWLVLVADEAERRGYPVATFDYAALLPTPGPAPERP